MKKLLKQYEEYKKEIRTQNFLGYLISWDNETEAPSKSIEARSFILERLAEKDFDYSTSKKVVNLINSLYDRRDEIEDEALRYEIGQIKKSQDKILKLPKDLFVELASVEASSQAAWAKAKNSSDFSVFRPYLEKLIDLTRKKIKYLETDELKGYDLLLDDYAEGMNKSVYDKFFGQLEKELIPFVKKVTAKKQTGDFSFGTKCYPVAKQKEFAQYIMDVMCFDRERGTIKESEHPFTSGFGNSDVRITVHYYPELFASSIFSAIHELGHATYEQQSGDHLVGTLSEGCSSLALHESQSRFYENIIGRSREFWNTHFDKLKELFPEQLFGVTADDMYKFVNIAENSYIRTEADELTYPLHIMLRYNIERELFDGDLKVEDLPERWNALFKEYFGIDVPSDKEGVLQDVHWAGALFGYFPTYALGSAYASQIFDAMNKDFDVFKSLECGTTKQINDWLKEKLHKYGSSKPPKALFENAAGAEFDASHYINYLKEKYGKLYGVE